VVKPDAISQAIVFASKAHRGQLRKGTSIPYVWHALSVGKLLQDAGAPSELVVAGILHDTVEDTSVTLEEIEERFGSRVAEVVRGCSESDKSLPWEQRKMHTIESLRTAPAEVKIVSAADKLDNLRAIRSDLEEVGDGLWKRFRRGRDKQEGYYRSVLTSLESGSEQIATHPLVCALEAEIESVFGAGSSKKSAGEARLEPMHQRRADPSG